MIPRASATYKELNRLPSGITVEQLSGPHLSELRNPLIAEAFHRTGAVEIWGRGTNRVIEECQRYRIAPPTFDDWGGSLVVTFRVPIISGAGAESRDQVGIKSGLSRDQVEVLRLCREAQPLLAMMDALGRQNRTKFRDGIVKPLIERGCSN